MRRYRRLWNEWERRVRDGARPHELLPTLPDETLVGLLAVAGPERFYERDILAAELLNRLRRGRWEKRNVDEDAPNS